MPDKKRQWRGMIEVEQDLRRFDPRCPYDLAVTVAELYHVGDTQGLAEQLRDEEYPTLIEHFIALS